MHSMFYISELLEVLGKPPFSTSAFTYVVLLFLRFSLSWYIDIYPQDLAQKSPPLWNLFLTTQIKLVQWRAGSTHSDPSVDTSYVYPGRPPNLTGSLSSVSRWFRSFQRQSQWRDTKMSKSSERLQNLQFIDYKFTQDTPSFFFFFLPWNHMPLWALRCDSLFKPWGISLTAFSLLKVNIHKAWVIMDPRDWRRSVCPMPQVRENRNLARAD